MNTVHNLITFSIVFTYKNGMDRFEPPPPSNKLNLNLIETKVNKISHFIQITGHF